MEQIKMPFDGSVVEVVRDPQGQPWVGVRSVCTAVGMDSSTQIEKLKRDTRFMRWDMPSHDTIGRVQDVFCIPLEQLNGWLFSINPNKVPDHVRPNLVAYQQECFSVLCNHFMPRGEVDLQPLMDRIQRGFTEVNAKLDYLNGATEAIFGDDKDDINTLVKQVAEKYQVDGRTVWGWVQTDCDVGSYKKGTMRVKNYLLNKLGKGIMGSIQGGKV